MAVADPEEGPGGPCPPLFLDQTEARRAEKNFLETPPPLPKGLDDFPPPYLKVWIPHCFVFPFYGNFLALVSNWQESLSLTKMKTSLMKFSILLSQLRLFNFFQFVTKMPNIFHVDRISYLI